MARRAWDLTRERTEAPAAQPAAGLVALDDPRARAAVHAGAKAAALAIAAANGLPVLPGAVLTTCSTSADDRLAWEALAGRGLSPVAVRSSSTLEDQASSSMAGQFTTVLDVHDWPSARDAIARVRASSRGGPMAVLLQPMCDAVVGGVLFGIDPVSGRRDRMILEVVEGGPNALVSGTVSATRYTLTRRGRILDVDGDVELTDADARRLAALGRRAAQVFDGPQDVEWAIDRDGTLWMLQSRPVTAVGASAVGPRFGPGPIAETFPDALAPLEVELWVEPLRAGIAEALHLTAAQPSRAIDSSPVLVDIDGRIAADLDLLEGRRRTGLVRLIDPRPSARRFAAAWRVGRLRRALPLLARDLVRSVDHELRTVPELQSLTEAELLAVIGNSRIALRALHGHEVLAGVLTADDGATGVALALRAVAASRAAGMSDEDIAAVSPISLALVPPRIAATIVFPPVPTLRSVNGDDAELGPREALRIRARWVQELTARAAALLGERLAAAGRLPDPLAVRWLRLEELAAMVRDGMDAPADLMDRIAVDLPAPLPAAFRLAEDGSLVVLPSDVEHAGRGAGGGRGVGVVGTAADPALGTVLVVRTLEPGLAATLPGRAGLVAETGSVLSHLAIVARELGVPTVVGVTDAVDRFPPGTRIVVDGHTGQVEVVS